MSNKAHLRPHRKKRQARRTTGLIVVILLAALVALATAMAASGHTMPPGRILPLYAEVGGQLAAGCSSTPCGAVSGGPPRLGRPPGVAARSATRT
jgi:hypothetical protein